MRRRDFAISASISVIVIGMLAYLPVVIAWSSAITAEGVHDESLRVMVAMEIEGLTVGKRLVISNGVIEAAPFLYIPVLRLHGKLCGFWVASESRYATGEHALMFAPID